VFITFEGIEGCGKSTQARRLVNRLRDASVPVVFTLEPGGTRVGSYIRRILLDSGNRSLSPLAELFLYEADRAQHVEEKIRPALEQGKWVVCDRFFDATTVYQGFARGQDMKLVRNLNKRACLGIRPDRTFLIDCPVEIGIKRALKRNEKDPEIDQDRFEREEMDFHEAVRKGYLIVAQEDPERIVVLDCRLTEDELEAAIFERIRPFI
jgi:dTMP kinase